jgi:tetratricopeptide (TPR) repeat protein
MKHGLKLTGTGRFILVVVASLLIAAVALSPRRGEHAAILAGEGRHREAIALLKHRLETDPNDPDIQAALGRSYAALGEVDKAIAAFDAYLAARPNDQAARDREAELLLRAGATDRYLDAMALATKAKPSPARVTRLVELYRLHGRTEDEIDALRTYADKGMLEEPQLERLGALLAARGDCRNAEHWLELADQRSPPDTSAGRLLLLEVIIQGGDAAYIERRAGAWLAAWRNPYLAGKIVLMVAQSGNATAASALAFKQADTMPDDALAMVGFLAGKGWQDIAHGLLVRWADRTDAMDGAEVRAFVHESAVLGDADVAFGKFRKMARIGSNPSGEGQLAEDLVDSFGDAALDAILPFLSDGALLARPLFAARISLSDGDAETARRYLARVDPARLPPEKLTAWLALEHQAGMDSDAFTRLAELVNSGILPAEAAPDLADAAAQIGQDGMHDMIWDSLKR